MPGPHNGAADAFRHSLFNALNTQIAGEKTAKELGDAHEDDGDLLGQPIRERIMDEHNNRIGREVANDNPNATPLELAGILLEKIENGEMLIIGDDGKLKPSSISPEEKASVQENLINLYQDGDPRNTSYDENAED